MDFIKCVYRITLLNSEKNLARVGTAQQSRMYNPDEGLPANYKRPETVSFVDQNNKRENYTGDNRGRYNDNF